MLNVEFTCPTRGSKPTPSGRSPGHFLSQGLQRPASSSKDCNPGHVDSPTAQGDGEASAGDAVSP